MEYVYRQLMPDDEKIVWRMLYEAARMAEEGHSAVDAATRSPELVKYAEDWGRDGDIGIAAFEAASQRPVGAAWIRLLIGANQGYGYLDDKTPELAMGVVPEHRNKGVGTKLLALLMEAAGKGYSSMGLNVRADSPAVRFYERCGFEMMHGSDITNRVGGRSFTMKRRLK